MADTQTANLGLIKPEVGASEDEWNDKWTTNWDTLDAAFGLTYAGDPNGNVAGTYVGQRLFDTTNRLTWTCHTTGNSSTAVWTAEGDVEIGAIASFHGATAPLGWAILDTAGFDHAMLRLRDAGSTDTGGTLDFTDAFGTGLSTDAHILTEAEIPSHDHTLANHSHGMAHTHNALFYGPTGTPAVFGSAPTSHRMNLHTPNSDPRFVSGPSTGLTGSAGAGDTGDAGGDGGHSHGIAGINVKFVDIQLCERTA